VQRNGTTYTLYLPIALQPAQPQPSPMALTIAEVLVSLGLTPAAAQRRLTRLQGAITGPGHATWQVLDASAGILA
jgi:hypothetical protein